MAAQLEIMPKVGRPALLTPAQLQEMRATLEFCEREGFTFPLAALALKFEVSASTVSRAARKLRKGIDEVLHD